MRMTREQAAVAKFIREVEEAQQRRDRNIARIDVAEKIVKRVVIGAALTAIFGPFVFF